MKKKKLKNALLCALAVPCMFVATGCKDKVEPISANEYANLVYEAGSNYVKNHSDYKTYGDMTLNTSRTTTASEKVKISYKANAQATELSEKEVTITATSSGTQVIEINRDETENGDIALKITQTSVETEKGERANSDTDLLENYEEKEESTAVYTFVKSGEDYKLFKHIKRTTKATGEDDTSVERKEVRTFESQATFQTAIESILEEVDEDLVESMLSASGEMMFMSPEAYKGDDKFGMTMKYTMTDNGYDGMYKTDVEYKFEFENNLPHAVNMDTKTSRMDGSTNDRNEGITITYSASAISAPTDSADYTANNLISYDDIISD